jgi:hypothetical protein
MAPGALPRPSRVPEQRLLSPKICLRRRRRCRTVLGKTPTSLGFSVLRLYIGEGASSEGCQGALTMGRRSQGLGHAPLLCGRPLASLWLSFGLRYSSRKNKTSRTCLVQSRKYFLYSFSKTQNSKKQGTGTVASCQ